MPKHCLLALKHGLPALLLPLALAMVGCGEPAERQTVIRVEGSDTMVNLAQAWAELYHQTHPGVSVQVLGGGSGVGIASLIDGNCDIADSSRTMKPQEIEKVRSNRGDSPQEIVAGLDALAVYVHKDNPLNSISIEDLAEVFGEPEIYDAAGQVVGRRSQITQWSQLGGDPGSRGFTEIVRVNRQNSSGTYAYFREKVLYGKDEAGQPTKSDYRLGSVDQSGSKDVIALVASTPCAIGYGGMGYQAPGVKMLTIARRRGQPGIAPTVANARSGSYPITRPLLMYTVGKPEGAIKDYIAWILSPDGQKVVEELGYVGVGGRQ
jgi:phosphate transport system substrate-binding protein